MARGNFRKRSIQETSSSDDNEYITKPEHENKSTIQRDHDDHSHLNNETNDTQRITKNTNSVKYTQDYSSYKSENGTNYNNNKTDYRDKYDKKTNLYDKTSRNENYGSLLDREDGDIGFSETIKRYDTMDLSKRMDLPKENDILKGSIVNVKEFGSFVRVPQYKYDGLVSINEYIYDKPPPKINDVVYVKVLQVYEKDGKPRISYSIRRVSQVDGKDIELKQVNDFTPVTQANVIRFEMEARCTRCGGKGHLSSSCWVDLSKVNHNNDYLNDFPSSSEDENIIIHKSMNASSFSKYIPTNSQINTSTNLIKKDNYPKDTLHNNDSRSHTHEHIHKHKHKHIHTNNESITHHSHSHPL